MMNNKIKTALSVLVVTASLVSTHAMAGSADAGKQKSVVCAACHGADGKAPNPMYPSLAGQNEQYLALALKAYKENKRINPQGVIMSGMAAPLSEQDIADLAAYYASLK